MKFLLAVDRWVGKVEGFCLAASLVALLLLTLYSVMYRNLLGPIALKMQSEVISAAESGTAPAVVEAASNAGDSLKTVPAGADAKPPAEGAAKPATGDYAGDLDDDAPAAVAKPAEAAPAAAAKTASGDYAGDLDDDSPAAKPAGEGADAAPTAAPAAKPAGSDYAGDLEDDSPAAPVKAPAATADSPAIQAAATAGARAPAAPLAEMRLPEDTPMLAFLKWLTFSWIDVVTRHLLLYIGFFGAALAVRQRGHIKIELLSRLFKGHYGDKLRIFLDLVSMVVCAFLVRAAWRFLLSESEGGGTLYGSIPSWVGIIIVPVGFGLLSFHCALEALLGILASLGVGTVEMEARRVELGLNEEVPR